MQADSTDIVRRWTLSGFLRGVPPQHLARAAARLERAHRSMVGSCNWDLLNDELRAMDREGLFSRSMNSR